MRSQRSKIVALIGAAALAAPPAAGAQGAVDEQYRDPFAGQDNSGSDTGQPAPGDDTSAPTTQAGSAPQPAPADEPAPVASTPGELPRTGLAAALIAVAGTALVAAGAALRRRLH